MSATRGSFRFFFFSSRRRHTRCSRDWSSDVCSSDLELNDIPTMVIQHHESSYWQERVRDQFDRLYLEGARNPRVMAIAVHPYIHGVPHRIKYFEAAYDYIRKHRGVWLTTGEEIYEWYKRTAQSSEPPPRRVAGGARARTAATPTRSRVTRD